ncbi:zinc-dependent alcohol dehydrogenase family protein [Streptomyces sp. NBC_01497]|uniref:zinc-dependent alcohol dehydrogenase family protein n=1 Tax=Streptomyces sp. NBC_01497 TaxID=2903885 RepID=UPI002E345A57|nr:zinc-dependent alcohol dehydrogenase family protein [Streptomyces sp. NBC_01497]
MNKIILTAVGGNTDETVALVQEPTPTPGADEVLVAVEAAPVNNADLLFAAGWFGVYPQVPNAMGAEGVGRVVAVGAGVSSSLVGERVLVLPTFVQGTWADQVVVPAGNVVPVTGKADPLQLAMLPVNPATAYSLLHDYVELRAGDWVGIDMANSAVGQYVIALAKKAGVNVLAVVRREETVPLVRELGATLVVVDGEDLGDRVAQALDGKQLRLLLEGVGGTEPLEQLARSVEAGGTVVAFSAATGQSPALPLADLIYRGVVLRSFFILNWIRTTPRAELERIYAELAELVEQDVINATVEATYPLAKHQEALAHAARTGRTGKILFVPAGTTR